MLLPGGSKDALDMIKNCMQFNPTKRLSAEQCLEHPFVGQFHKKDQEPNAPSKFKIPADDNVK